MKHLLVLAFLASPAFAAFPNGYSYCKPVTTKYAMVSGPSDLTNYPLTVILTDPDLKTAVNGGLVNSSSGFDIAFYPDCSGAGTALAWEMESYSPTTGAIVAHVLRPTLSRTLDDTIGMYYGGSQSTAQSTASAVWDLNYKGVWHLANGASLSTADSVASPHNGTASGPVASAGQIDGGARFASNNTADVITMGTAAVNLNTGTIEMWVKPAYASTDPLCWSQFFFDTDNARHAPFLSASNVLTIYNDSRSTDFSVSWSANTWHHLVFVYNKTGNVQKFYFDGVEKTGGNVSGTWGSTAMGAVAYIGRRFTNVSGQHNAFQGVMDEVRASDIVRSADWILTEYRNQSAPGTYLTVGSRLSGSQPVRVRHSVRDGF